MILFHLKEKGLIRKIANIVKMKEKGLDLTTFGSIINQTGISLNYRFVATGFNEQTRLSLDQEARMIFIDQVENE